MIRLDIARAYGAAEIKREVRRLMGGRYADLLPRDKSAPIMLKPNLNANMNALTGNTTDLRLIAAVIEALKDRGHTDIAIGEGTNSGYYRNRISVISRLKVDALAGHYGVKVLDFNYAEPLEIEFEDGIRASIAKPAADAALLINMPKLKTHFEAGMSVCLKNLMGCLVGQENKKKTHKSLAANIVNINRAIRPALHIVDALVSMEGLGPTRGTPIRTGAIIMGDDPYAIDLACARFAGFPAEKVRPLVSARNKGLVTREHDEAAAALMPDAAFRFKPPAAGPIATFIHSPKRQKYFLAIRNTRLFDWVCSTKLAGKLLYATGLRQDVFIDDDMAITGITIDGAKCTQCGRCAEYCPTGVALPATLAPLKDARCIGCLYCFCVCPERAISIEGAMGFMDEQLRQYDDIIRRMA